MSTAALSNHRSQRDRIIAILLQARGSWVCGRELAAISLQYNARVFEGRHHLLLNIENKTEITEGGTRLSWFRLLPGAVRAEPRSPQQQEFALTGEENVRYPG
jgi:hypothetical protein